MEWGPKRLTGNDLIVRVIYAAWFSDWYGFCGSQGLVGISRAFLYLMHLYILTEEIYD